MTPEMIRDGQLDRAATADALRRFLEDLIRASGLELRVNVQPISETGASVEGDAEVLADLDAIFEELNQLRIPYRIIPESLLELFHGEFSLPSKLMNLCERDQCWR